MSQKQELLNNRKYIELFKNLNAIALNAKVSRPFLPIIPDSWDDEGSWKIMWCGAATNGWKLANSTDVVDLVQESCENDKWLKDKFSDRSLRSQFWRVQKKCLATLGSDWNKTVWQNMYKIGGIEGVKRGMPLNELQKTQVELCVKAFEIELEILKPKLVVLHVGLLTEKIMKEVSRGIDDSWHDLKQNGHTIASHARLNGTNLIWLSRKSVPDIVYTDYFTKCCSKLGV